MASNKGGSGRSRKNSSTKKPLKEPIPIDSGISQAINPDQAPQTHEYPRIEEEIRVRAYELYELRGRQDGLDTEDWVHAETEILAKYSKRPRSA